MSFVAGATTTFVLGDVVGSTHRWAEAAMEMPDDLARLEALVDELLARHGGDRAVEQGEGDSFVAAFERAGSAVGFALDLQGSLAASPVLPVRMAIHTGDAERRPDGRWMGPALNRCARLRALAHGGQVLVSEATAVLTVDDLPVGAMLRDLGVHRLKDLARPEPVRQLCHPELPADFAPLQSLDRFPHNLPVELTSFVGRAAELADLVRLLDGHRLVTLTGAGGAGKTRLALHAAARVVDASPGGVWVADLAATADTNFVPQALAAAMRLPEQPLQPMVDTIVAGLGDAAALVVLDNCEHLLDACASFAERLLRSCPNTRIVATSREPLGVGGEAVYRVPSLGLPAGDDDTACESVRLFVERAAVVRPTFALDAVTRPSVLELCRRLDGLPLAIELAASRCRAMAPAEIAEQLVDRLAILTAGRRSGLPRQRTLEASVQWSFDLLSDHERTLLRRLAVFAGGFSLAGAECVGAGDDVDAWAVVDLLTSLVDKSLVQVEDVSGRTRYRLLETIRVYAAQRLAEAGELASSRDRHLAHVIAFAESIEAGLMGTGDYSGAMAALEDDIDNVRAALDWAVDNRHGDAAWRLMAATICGWEFRHLREAGARVEALSAIPGGTPKDRVWVLCEGADSSFQCADIATQTALMNAASQVADVSGDETLQMRVRLGTSLQRLLQGDETAAGDFEAAATQFEHDGEDWYLASTLMASGFAAVGQGRFDVAMSDLDRVVSIGRKIGNCLWQANGLVLRASILTWQGAYSDAAGDAEAGLAVMSPLAPRVHEGFANVISVYCQSAAGHHEEAVALAERVMADARRYADAFTVAHGGLAQALASWRAGRPIDETGIDEAVAVATLIGFNYVAPALTALRAEHALAAGDIPTATRLASEAEAAVDASVFAALAWPATRRTAARVALVSGDLTAAEVTAHLALARSLEMNERPGVAQALETLARVAAECDSPLEAVRLTGGAAALRQRVGHVPGRPEELELNALADRLRTELGADEYATAWAEGEAMSQDEAVAYAQRGRGERKRPTFGWASLTPAERDVVELVAQGLRNADIAAKLFVSPTTVKTHLTHVFAKLGVATRAELAAQAAQRSTAPNV